MIESIFLTPTGFHLAGKCSNASTSTASRAFVKCRIATNLIAMME